MEEIEFGVKGERVWEIRVISELPKVWVTSGEGELERVGVRIGGDESIVAIGVGVWEDRLVRLEFLMARELYGRRTFPLLTDEVEEDYSESDEGIGILEEVRVRVSVEVVVDKYRV